MENCIFTFLKIYLTDHYVRTRDFFQWKYTEDHYVQTKRSYLKNQIGQNLAMVSSICYIIGRYLKEFNKFISSNFVQSIQTASPQILYKTFKSRTLSMYRFNLQDYKIKYAGFLSGKSAFKDSFEGCRCLQSVTELLLSHSFFYYPTDLQETCTDPEIRAPYFSTATAWRKFVSVSI